MISLSSVNRMIENGIELSSLLRWTDAATALDIALDEVRRRMESGDLSAIRADGVVRIRIKSLQDRREAHCNSRPRQDAT